MGPCFFIFLESLCLYPQLENTDISHSLELIQKKKKKERKVYHNKKLGKIQRKTAEEEKKNKRTIR